MADGGALTSRGRLLGVGVGMSLGQRMGLIVGLGPGQRVGLVVGLGLVVGVAVSGCESGSGAAPPPRTAGSEAMVAPGTSGPSERGSLEKAVGSAGNQDSNRAGAEPPAQVTNDSPGVPFALGESWSGSYWCAQGVTALTLKIDSSGPQVEALFDFDVPDGTSGSFAMSGSYEMSTRHLHLVAGDWLRQPSGYVTVDLDGSVSSDGRIYSGNVLGPGCKSFRVQKGEPPTTHDPE